MKITLYNVVSSDGFIATKDGKEDFIPNKLWSAFIDLCNKNDIVVWGKNSYEAFKSYDKELVDQFLALPIKKVILTRDENWLPSPPFSAVRSIKELSSMGENILVSSSFVLNDLLIKEKLISKVIVNVLPIAIGEGILQFKNDPPLSLVSENKHVGWIEKIYEVTY